MPAVDRPASPPYRVLDCATGRVLATCADQREAEGRATIAAALKLAEVEVQWRTNCGLWVTVGR